MIFGLFSALLHGLLFLGGPSGRISEIRSRILDNVEQGSRRAATDMVLDDAERVVVAARKEEAVLQQDLERLLARPDATPAELAAKLDELDGVEAAAFTKLVKERRRLTLAVTPGEWRVIFHSTEGR